MNEDILQRAMFAMPLSPEAQNSGILSGFMDDGSMGDEEPVSQEDMDLEEMPVMARTPQNPEILMNNLRGDMRSLDARYVELAQMVGEQAAMDTPPEVLAMLMGQAGAQQQAAAAAAPAGAPGAPGPAAAGAGIGALPQGQEMAPPGMMPPDMGMQAPPPEMMPQGMGDMGPFPSGGAEQAPPQQFAVGGLVAGARLAGPALARGAQQLNQYLGSKFMAPQFTTQAVRGPGGQQLVGQARESLRMLPGGQIAQGTGTQLAPMSTLGQMASPTFTQGIRQGLAPVLGSTTGQLATGLGAGSLTAAGMLNAFGPDQQMSEEDILAAQSAMRADTSGIPGEEPLYTPAVRTEEPQVLAPEGAPAAAPVPVTEGAPEAPADDTNSFIDRVTAEAKKRTRAERVREAYDELSPLYKELLGDDEDTRKTQALLLLAEAGFKFAGSTKPTMGMALGEALSGIPAGMSTLAAQKAEREAKLKAAALSQAVEGVEAEDKAARALQLEMLKGDYRIMQEQAKKTGDVIIEDGGAGLRVAKTKNGSFLNYSIDPNDPTVKRAVTSRFTLTPNNPFVVVGGEAPQAPETDKASRVTLSKKLRDLDTALGLVETMKSNFTGAYGGGAWFSEFNNNMLVPISPLNPNVQDAAKIAAINQDRNRLITLLASADTEGRTSVYAQERVDGIMPAPAGTFFQDAEVNAGRLNALHALVLNQRQAVMAQQGYVTQELTMTAPSTGTKNDPFALPADEQGQANMLRFLGGTIGKVTDPNALVYIRTPDGTVRPFKTSELRTLGGQ
jgi:hypothetical protein